MAKFYIATKLSNRFNHNQLRDVLLSRGHKITFDWTKYGDNVELTREQLKDIQAKELNGINKANIIFCLFPVGRGTHVEIGYALAKNKTIIIHSEDREVFLPTIKTSAFYYNPAIKRVRGKFSNFLKIAHHYLYDNKDLIQKYKNQYRNYHQSPQGNISL